MKYEDSVKEKDALSTQLIQGEIEKKDAIMSKDKSDKKTKETAKVWCMLILITYHVIM